MTQDGTYELDGWAFGTPAHDVIVLAGGVDFGSAEPRVDDVDNPVGDGSLFGRDLLAAPTYQFTLGIQDDTNVRARLAELAARWRPARVRSNPSALQVLRFTLEGQTYRVYGRGRQFAEKVDDVMTPGWAVVDATFKLALPVVEVDAGPNNTITLQLVAGPADGGLVLPAEVPFLLQPSSQGRENYTTVKGSVPAAFALDIKGPVSGALTNARVYGPGWSFSIGQPIAWDQTVRIDTRTQTVTINGAQRPGLIGPRDRLTARLALGNQTIGFTGQDPTNTATATLSWRDHLPI